MNIVRRFFPNWKMAEQSKYCKWCPKEVPGVVRVFVGPISNWVCRDHIDNALDEISAWHEERKK